MLLCIPIMEGMFQCTNSMCTMVLEQFNEQKTHSEQLKIENEVLRISLNDCATTNEAAIKEMKRLLEKETNLVNILNSELAPDPNGMYPSCAWCMHHRQQARVVREANAQEYRWVVHFAKLSRNLRLELEETLLKEKTKYSQLKCAYDELHLKKTDPFCRDGEIVRLRHEIADVKQNQSNANQTALMANKVADVLQKELMMAQQRGADLETNVNDQSIRIKTLEEIVDTCRRSSDLKDCAVGECKDYVCRRRAMDLYHKEKELRVQIDSLQRERVRYLHIISQMKQDSEQWKVVLSGQPYPEDQLMIEAEPVPVVRAKAQGGKVQMVADLTSFTELVMNLRSLFQIFPAWYSENLEEGGMLSDFVADTEPSERIENLRWILATCHGGITPIDVKNEELVTSKITKKCFSACIKALGGVSRKIGSKIVWVNIRRTRRPIYAQ